MSFLRISRKAWVDDNSQFSSCEKDGGSIFKSTLEKELEGKLGTHWIFQRGLWEQISLFATVANLEHTVNGSNIVALFEG